MWTVLLKKVATVFFPIIKKHWGKLTILAICIIVGIYINWLKADIDDLTERNGRLTSELNILRDKKMIQDQLIDKQNDAIALLEKQRIEAQEVLFKIEKENQRKVGNLESQLEQLKKQPAPQTCEDSKRYLRDGIEDLTW